MSRPSVLALIALAMMNFIVAGGADRQYARRLAGVDRAVGGGPNIAGVAIDVGQGGENVTCLFKCSQPFLQTSVYLTHRAVAVTKPCEQLRQSVACFNECSASDVKMPAIASFGKLEASFCQPVNTAKSRQLVQQTQQCYNSFVEKLTNRFNFCLPFATASDGAPPSPERLFECIMSGDPTSNPERGCEDPAVAAAMSVFFGIYLELLQSSN